MIKIIKKWIKSGKNDQKTVKIDQNSSKNSQKWSK